jgi:hypothetical protein
MAGIRDRLRVIYRPAKYILMPWQHVPLRLLREAHKPATNLSAETIGRKQ